MVSKIYDPEKDTYKTNKEPLLSCVKVKVLFYFCRARFHQPNAQLFWDVLGSSPKNVAFSIGASSLPEV